MESTVARGRIESRLSSKRFASLEVLSAFGFLTWNVNSSSCGFHNTPKVFCVGRFPSDISRPVTRWSSGMLSITCASFDSHFRKLKPAQLNISDRSCCNFFASLGRLSRIQHVIYVHGVLHRFCSFRVDFSLRTCMGVKNVLSTKRGSSVPKW